MPGSLRRCRLWPCPPPGPGPDRAARAASTASAGSDLPVRRRDWRLGRSTSTTSMPARRRDRAKPAPYELVPSMPTWASGPKALSQANSSLCPELVVGNSATPSKPPMWSTAAATLSVQMGVHTACHGPRRIYDRHCHPFSRICQGVARAAPGVRRRCDRPVGAGRSAAPKVRLVPLKTWSPVDTLLHRQAEPSADLKSGQGPVEPDGSTLHLGGGGSPGIKLYWLTLPAEYVALALHRELAIKR